MKNSEMSKEMNPKITNDSLQNLMQKANDVGILNISAHGGITEHILRDAIETSEYVDKYFEEHPE
jgi:hypothetical protein